jgi:aquaporin Z
MCPHASGPRAGWSAGASTQPLGLHRRCPGAEAAGTALLVLGALSAVALVLGQGSPLAAGSSSVRLLVTGLLVGACIALIAVSPLGRLSGAHINPAVTLGFWAFGMVRGPDVLGYLAAQLPGALLGGRVPLAMGRRRPLGGRGRHTSHRSGRSGDRA